MAIVRGTSVPGISIRPKPPGRGRRTGAEFSHSEHREAAEITETAGTECLAGEGV